MFEVGSYVTFLNEKDLINAIERAKEKYPNRSFSNEYISCTRNLAGLTFEILQRYGNDRYVLEGENANLFYSQPWQIRWRFFPEFFTQFYVEDNSDILPLFG